MKLFVTSTCPECLVAKKYIDEHPGCAEVYNIEDVNGLTEFSILGIPEMQVPILVEGEERPYKVTTGASNIIEKLGGAT